MSAVVRSRGRGQRTPGFVNVAGAMVLVLVVLLLAIPAHTQGPPAVAEYAPQPQQPIQQAPPEQNASLGKGQGTGRGPGGAAGGGGTGAPTAAPTNPPLPSGVVFRNCVGSPPRQIEDPQSPPCVPYWKGNNGGNTAKGVTGTTITIAMDSSVYINQYTSDLINFFNNRFEFYGRTLVLKPYTSSEACGNSATTCGSTTTMAADAASIDQTISPFADLGYVAGGTGGDEYYFYDQLAQRGIMSMELSSRNGAPFVDEAHLTQFAPYEWDYLPALDDDLNQLGQFICAQLPLSQSPKYAGAPTNTMSRRSFGVMVENYATALQPNLQPLLSNSCGVPFKVVEYQNTQQDQVNAMLQLKSAGVTSVVCVCRSTTLSESLFPAANGQGYFPEWVVDNYGVQDDDFLMAFYGENSEPSQTQHVVGISAFNKWLPGADMPVNWAAEDVDPAATCPSGCYAWEFWAQYWDLLVLASGIQMAGPDLTPATFQAGLFRTTFPNPHCGAAPYYQGCVGFGPGDHGMVQDDAMVWWNNTAQEPYYFQGQTQPGAYCYIGLGRRWRNNWPAAPQPLQASNPCY